MPSHTLSPFTSPSHFTPPQNLTQQQRVLEKGGRFPDGDSSEPTRLRQLFLQHQNQLDQSHQRLAKLQAQVDR